MSEDTNFQITIEGAYSERFIGTLDTSVIADAILYGISDEGFSDFCLEELELHWYDLHTYLHNNGMHSGNISIKQGDNKIFDISIEDILDDPQNTIADMAKLRFDNGFYYLRIEWEGRGDIIQLEGKVDEDERDEWKEDFENVFSKYDMELGLLISLETYSSLGEIDLTEVGRPNPSGSDQLIVARGNIGGETKTIAGLAEFISIMKKDNVELLDKEKITNYLNVFIDKND